MAGEALAVRCGAAAILEDIRARRYSTLVTPAREADFSATLRYAYGEDARFAASLNSGVLMILALTSKRGTPAATEVMSDDVILRRYRRFRISNDIGSADAFLAAGRSLARMQKLRRIIP